MADPITGTLTAEVLAPTAMYDQPKVVPLFAGSGATLVDSTVAEGTKQAIARTDDGVLHLVAATGTRQQAGGRFIQHVADGATTTLDPWGTDGTYDLWPPSVATTGNVVAIAYVAQLEAGGARKAIVRRLDGDATDLDADGLARCTGDHVAMAYDSAGDLWVAYVGQLAVDGAWSETQVVTRKVTLYSGADSATDDFNRGDGSLGANWDVLVGAAVIASNQVKQTSFGGTVARYVPAGDAVDDGVAAVELSRGVMYNGVAFRVQGTGQCYAAAYWGTQNHLRLFAYDGNTTLTMLASALPDPVGAQAYGVKVVYEGTSIQVWAKLGASYATATWAKYIDVTDTTFATGGVGFFSYAPNAILDNWAYDPPDDVGAPEGINAGLDSAEWPDLVVEADDTPSLVFTALIPAATADDFNRADGSLGANWSAAAGDATIVGNEANSGANMSSVLQHVPLGFTVASGQVEVQHPTGLVQSGVAFRIQSGGSGACYAALWSSSTNYLRLYARDGAANLTLIGSAIATAGTCYGIRAVYGGTSLTIYARTSAGGTYATAPWVKYIEVTDATYSTGGVGFYAQLANCTVDNWVYRPLTGPRRVLFSERTTAWSTPGILSAPTTGYAETAAGGASLAVTADGLLATWVQQTGASAYVLEVAEERSSIWSRSRISYSTGAEGDTGPLWTPRAFLLGSYPVVLFPGFTAELGKTIYEARRGAEGWPAQASDLASDYGAEGVDVDPSAVPISSYAYALAFYAAQAPAITAVVKVTHRPDIVPLDPPKPEHIWIFDEQEWIEACLSNTNDEACPYTDDMHVSRIDGFESLEFTVPGGHIDAASHRTKRLVAYPDIDGIYRLFRIQKVTDDVSAGKWTRTVSCDDSATVELNGLLLAPIKHLDKSASYMLGQVLLGSRWKAGTVEWAGTGTLEWTWGDTAWKAVTDIATYFGLEIVRRVEVGANGVSGRYIDLVVSQGTETYKCFDVGKDIVSLKRIEDGAAVYSGVVAVGASKADGTFVMATDIVWSKAGGDPYDKPADEYWLDDPDLVQRYGVLVDGVMQSQRYVFPDPDETNPSRLLQRACDDFERRKYPCAYELEAVSLERIPDQGDGTYEHERVRLGDLVTVRNSKASPPTVDLIRVTEVSRCKSDKTKDRIVVGYRRRTQVETLAAGRLLERRVWTREGVWSGFTG